MVMDLTNIPTLPSMEKGSDVKPYIHETEKNHCCVIDNARTEITKWTVNSSVILPSIKQEEDKMGIELVGDSNQSEETSLDDPCTDRKELVYSDKESFTSSTTRSSVTDHASPGECKGVFPTLLVIPPKVTEPSNMIQTHISSMECNKNHGAEWSTGCTTRQKISMNQKGDKSSKCKQSGIKCTHSGNQCAAVGEEPPTRRNLTKHSGRRLFKCAVRGKGFDTANGVTKHQDTQAGGDPYHHNTCIQSGDHLSTEQTHYKTYTCSVCGKNFNSQSHLSRHKYTHMKVKQFKCADCGKSFATRDNLRTHQHAHTGKEVYECSVCGKGFNHAGNLSRHIRIHTGEKPNKCTVCGKSFTQSGDCKKHEITHSGEKPYKCTVCGKSFTQLQNLTNHHRIHTGEKPYKCTVCGRTFNRRFSLVSHQQIHTG